MNRNRRRASCRALLLLLIMFCVVTNAAIAAAGQDQASAAQRKLQPEDLFRIRHVGKVAWSPDGRYAAIELSRSGTLLYDEVPSNEITLLDVQRHSLRTLSPGDPAFIGFFQAMWSPDGKRLAFLSVNRSAVVMPWVWTIGSAGPEPLLGLDLRTWFFDSTMIWVDKNRLAVVVWDAGATKSGETYLGVYDGRNAADLWKRAYDGQEAAVSVLQSGASSTPAAPSTRLVLINLATGARTTLAKGRVHELAASADGRSISFLREEPGLPGQAVRSYFQNVKDVDDAYMAVQVGTARHVIDSYTGAELPAAQFAQTSSEETQPKAKASAPLPRQDAELLSAAPTGRAALYSADASDGSHLWLCGGGGREASPCSEIWRGNEWMSKVKTGRAQTIAYKAQDGTSLIAWLLLPPDYAAGSKVPVVTIVYPGTEYDASPPWDLSVYQSGFWEHPQLFAALGYAVLMPSMPEAKNQAQKLSSLPNGVLPAVDAVVASGIADPDRIAVAGQSDGGFAVQGLITQTNRFRTAIASAGFSDLVSLYGTFYGQFRYGDYGPAEKGQVLRMLQMEKGVDALGAPPWANPELYRSASPIFQVANVQTPLMLIHGDIDFVPIQQDEEFFTALLRQDKRAEFIRYQGEGHTIVHKADVLDLWQRVAAWLSETMPARP